MRDFIRESIEYPTMRLEYTSRTEQTYIFPSPAWIPVLGAVAQPQLVRALGDELVPGPTLVVEDSQEFVVAATCAEIRALGKPTSYAAECMGRRWPKAGGARANAEPNVDEAWSASSAGTMI